MHGDKRPSKSREAETFHDPLRSASAVHRKGTEAACAESRPESVEVCSCLRVVLSYRGANMSLAELLLKGRPASPPKPHPWDGEEGRPSPWFTQQL